MTSWQEVNIRENIKRLIEKFGPVHFAVMYDFVMQLMHLSRMKYEMDFDYEKKEIYITLDNEFLEIRIAPGLLTDDMG